MGTRLGLAGVPRRGPLFKEFPPSSGRPGALSFSRLALTGAPGRPHTFAAKNPAGFSTSRPAGRYSSLGLHGAPRSLLPDVEPKASSVGVVGRTTLTLTPQATTVVNRRYTQLTDLVLSIRPVGAVITAAHRSFISGGTTLRLTPQATNLRYVRDGSEYAFQGNNEITLTPHGFMRYRAFRVTLGSTTLSLTPRATLQYTPAGQRNHQVSARTTLRLTPQAVMSFVDGGVAYSISGANTISLQINGRIQVTRETTYAQHGSTTMTLRPQATITKGTGPPVVYHVAGSTTLTLTPNGTMGVEIGIVEQHFIQGSSPLRLVPQARVTVKRAPTITPIDLNRPGRRSFVRIFR